MSSTQHLRGVLCTPFANAQRSAGDDERLRALIRWVKDAAKKADIQLATVEGGYDSARQIIDRIYREIETADVVVTIVREANANAFFESGYAIGLGKPLLYIVREDEPVPFNTRGVEYFSYLEIDPETGEALSEALRTTLAVPRARSAIAEDLSFLRRHTAGLRLGNDIYGRCLAYALHGIRQWVSAWGQKSFEVRAQNLLDVGTFLLSQIEHGGFVTEYYSGHASWSRQGRTLSGTDYFAATRAAVRAGRAIVRVYVVDATSQIDEDVFRERAWADAAAGIEIHYILVDQLPDPRAKDFGLWDDELACEVEYVSEVNEAPRLYRLRYYADEFHVETMRSWRKRLVADAEPCPDLPSEMTLLEESATALTAEFVSYCADESDGKPDCSAYHIHWQLLRRLGLVSTPAWHAEFYAAAFRDWSRTAQLAEQQALSVLVCGLADYAMLYWVAQSLPNAVRDRCTFYVLDICESPLASCRWLERRLAERQPPMALRTEYLRGDVFGEVLNGEKPYDLITSDAFITRFEAIGVKRELMARSGRIVASGSHRDDRTRARGEFGRYSPRGSREVREASEWPRADPGHRSTARRGRGLRGLHNVVPVRTRGGGETGSA